MPIVNENERKRYKDKIGRLQYNRDTKVQTDNSVAMSNDVANVIHQSGISKSEVSEIVERVGLIEEQYKDLNEKFESFVNGTGFQVDETGLVVYDAPDDGKVWREKKGLLGLGKTKWVEEKI